MLVRLTRSLSLRVGTLQVDVRSYRGWTPLMRAAAMGHADVAQLLLGAGADAWAFCGTWRYVGDAVPAVLMMQARLPRPPLRCLALTCDPPFECLAPLCGSPFECLAPLCYPLLITPHSPLPSLTLPCSLALVIAHPPRRTRDRRQVAYRPTSAAAAAAAWPERLRRRLPRSRPNFALLFRRTLKART